MSEVLRNWILSLVGAALLGAFALSLTPAGRARSVVRLLGGVIMAIAMISPLRDFDFETYSMSLASYRSAAAQATERAAETNDRLSRTIIEQECAAYILDKAQSLGITPEKVTVTAKWGEALCWYPHEATVCARADAASRERLAQTVQTDLGIPAERLHWEGSARNE